MKESIEVGESMPKNTGLRPYLCDMCGEEQVYIMGKEVLEEKMLICPRCIYEELEQMRKVFVKGV